MSAGPSPQSNTASFHSLSQKVGKPSGLRSSARRWAPGEGRGRLDRRSRPLAADKDGNVELVPVLLVDGEKITHGAKDLAKVKVVAEVLGDLRGPKIVIQKFKNKTGYKKRQGHRQEQTRIKITSIA